jgi:dynein heavy chain
LVLIRAIRDSNIPKFVRDDLPLFNAIVKDLFPGVELQEAEYDMLINAVKIVQEEDLLTFDDKQMEKITQFYETMNVRFGLMIIG